MMKLEPVRRYSGPAYPTREWVRVHPEILRRLPPRWRNNPFVLGVLAAAPALGCSAKSSPRGGDGGTSDTTSPTARPGGTQGVAKRPALAKVAQIFEHGQGVASSGGVAATRIVFISEEEAVRIVKDEAAKAGLNFASAGKAIDELPLPSTSDYGTFASRETERSTNPRPPASHPGKLELDGTDAKHSVSFEFVSKQDFDGWKVPDTMGSTLSTFDLLGAARVLRDGLASAAPAGYYAVFYDPLPPFRPKAVEPGNPPATPRPTPDDEQPTLEQSREQLRAQVRDFIGWLKAQGAL